MNVHNRTRRGEFFVADINSLGARACKPQTNRLKRVQKTLLKQVNIACVDVAGVLPPHDYAVARWNVFVVVGQDRDDAGHHRGFA